MDRRAFLYLTGAVAATGGVAPGGTALSRIDEALARFRRLPGRTAYKIEVSHPGSPWERSYQPNAALFVGSAVKAFIDVKFLQDVEAGQLSEDAQVAVDDGVRSISSPVFRNLTGKTTARSALEAMIAHSDNTATDIALKAVGPDRVRAFISGAGLRSALIPTSTRLLFSYLAGAPFGVDKGWQGMLEIEADELFGAPRSPMNDRETMKCSAADFILFYKAALRGGYFRKPETLTEFKRIQAMADAIPLVVPADTPAYAKGGSIEWEGFNALCVAGQMIVGGVVPVTFCFTVNWDGPPGTVPTVGSEFAGAARAALHATATAFG